MLKAHTKTLSSQASISTALEKNLLAHPPAQQPPGTKIISMGDKQAATPQPNTASLQAKPERVVYPFSPAHKAASPRKGFDPALGYDPSEYLETVSNDYSCLTRIKKEPIGVDPSGVMPSREEDTSSKEPPKDYDDSKYVKYESNDYSCLIERKTEPKGLSYGCD